jgi:hypothetical protein
MLLQWRWHRCFVETLFSITQIITTFADALILPPLQSQQKNKNSN